MRGLRGGQTEHSERYVVTALWGMETVFSASLCFNA